MSATRLRTNEHVLKIDPAPMHLADSSARIEVRGKSKPVPLFCPIHKRAIEEREDIAMFLFPRRGGKDYTVAAKVVIDRLKGISPRDCSYVTLDRRRAVEWIGYVAQILRRFGVILDVVGYTEVSDESEYFVAEVRMPIPGMEHRVAIRALASTADGVRGRDGDIILSEAAFHANFEKLFDAALPCTQNGGQVIIVSTVNLDGDFHHELEKMAQRRIDGCPEPGDMVIALHRADIEELAWDGWEDGTGYLHVLNAADPARKLPGFTPRTPEQYIERAKKNSRTEEALLREYYHIRPLGASKFFPLLLVNECVSSFAPMPIRYSAPDRYLKKNDPGLERKVGEQITECTNRMLALMHEAASVHRGPMYAGADIGREGDKSSIWIKQRRDGMLRTVCLLTLRGCGFAEQLEVLRAMMNFRVNGVSVQRLVGDATGLGMMLMETLEREFKSRVDGKKWTAQNKVMMFTYAKSQVEQVLVDMPRDEETIRAICSVRQSFSATGNPIFDIEANSEGHGDEAAAFVMVCAAGDDDKPKFRILPVGRGAL
jgi:phage FluMu gp28-like protein